MSSDKEDMSQMGPESETIQTSEKDFDLDGSMRKTLNEIEKEIQLARSKVLQSLIAGALFDFAGYLATIDKPVTFSARHACVPGVILVTEFLKLRKFSPDCKPEIMGWQDKIRI